MHSLILLMRFAQPLRCVAAMLLRAIMLTPHDAQPRMPYYYFSFAMQLRH